MSARGWLSRVKGLCIGLQSKSDEWVKELGLSRAEARQLYHTCADTLRASKVSIACRICALSLPPSLSPLSPSLVSRVCSQAGSTTQAKTAMLLQIDVHGGLSWIGGARLRTYAEWSESLPASLHAAMYATTSGGHVYVLSITLSVWPVPSTAVKLQHPRVGSAFIGMRCTSHT